MRGLIMLGVLLASPALAQDAPKKKGELGSEWVEGGNSYTAQVSFQIDEPLPDPALYRAIAYDWKTIPLQSGWYPRAAFAARKEGRVGVSIIVSDDGKASGCTVTKASGVASLDADACPHVMAYTHYFPALTRDGQRHGGTIAATLNYTLRIYMETELPGGGPRPLPRAEPVTPVTLASLGITAGMIPKGVYGIGAWVRVDGDGHAASCMLYSPTQSDALDKQVCDRLMAIPYRPASNGGESLATVSLEVS